MEEHRRHLETKLVLYALLSVTMMAGIFAFSGQNGPESSSESDGIARWIASHVAGCLGQMDAAGQEALAKSLTWPIRKAAHMTEYALLAGLLAASYSQAFQLRGSEKFGTMTWAAAFATAALYAMTDELHQTFVPGREGRPADVLIDAIGIAIGALVVVLFTRRRQGKKNR